MSLFGNIANITTSFIEIPGKICTNVFLSGCHFHCIGCQNKELQSFDYGKIYGPNEIIDTINSRQLPSCVCFLGGEPFCQSEFLYELCKNISKPIGIYTGYDFDDVNKKFLDIINIQNVVFLKTGKFEVDLYRNNEFPISSNQKIYLKQNGCWSMCKNRDVQSLIDDVKKIF